MKYSAPMLGIAALAGFLFLAISSELEAKQIDGSPGDFGYVVRNVKGEVVARDSLAGGWRSVKVNQFLHDQTLLQVGEASAITLQRSSRSNKREIKPVLGLGSELKLATPMVARLGEGLIRPIKFSKNFIQNEFQDELNKERIEDNKVFSESWKRTVDFMTFKMNRPKDDSKDPRISGQLDVMFPGHSPFFELEKGSIDIDISWVDQRKNKSSSYRIYAWKKGEEKGPPVGISSSLGFTLSINETGDYLVQVETGDGKVLSRPLDLYVSDDSTKTQLKDGVESSAEELVKLLAPSDSQIFSDPVGVVPIRFVWRYLVNTDTPLVLTIRRGQVIVHQESIQGNLSTAVVLPVGVYYWQVKKRSKSVSGTDGSDVSEEYKFTVRQSQPADAISAAKDALKSKSKLTIFVSDW